MAADVIRLGPFTGGLNTSSDPSAIADAELVELTNMEVSLDDSLVSRPPFHTVADMSGTWTERIVAIGSAVFPGGNYIIGSNTNGVYFFISGGWTLITATFQAACMVQYADLVWLIAKPGSANPGGQWDPVGGFVAQSNLPKGDAAAVFKERLFVVPGGTATANTSRLIFSEPANFLDYNPVTGGNQASPGTNFIDVSQGDGQKLIDLLVYRGNLLLFKNDSTYILAYETSPADAVVENISITVGASQRRCVVAYENSVFIYHEGFIFELVNYDFNRINVKLPLQYDGGAPAGTTRVEEVFMCLFGDRLVIRYYNNTYVLGLRTRVWSQWKSASDFLHNFGPLVALPSNVVQSVNTEYYGGSSLSQHEKFYRIRDGYDSTTDENDGASVLITVTALTKNYDVAASHLFKRLNWWGADVLTNNTVIGALTPITFSFQVLWSDLASLKWNQLLTWQNPTTNAASVSTAVATGSGTQRRFVRFIKSVRYRQINFRITMTTNGTTTDGPARLYTIAIATKVKQLVPKAVN